MKPEFITYQKFNDPALADELAEHLDRHNIDYQIEEESLTFNITFLPNDALQKEYAVKIKSKDFETVNRLLKDDEIKNIEDVDKSYYLFTFTDDELMEVITKADEWSAFDVVLARKLLGERGRDISEATILAINQNRITELKNPEPTQRLWVIIGYVIALSGLILPFFVFIIGLFIGGHLAWHKKTLPDGERVMAYNENDRKHGKRIFYLSIITFALQVIYGIVYFE